jgi:hypothetical protein
MTDKAMEERHLALATKHIWMAEKNVAEQEERIKRLAALSCDTTLSEQLLVVFKKSLQEIYIHRDQILAALDD